MRLYEGCLVKLRERPEIFYIKGLVEEDGYVIVLPRYIPSDNGRRVDSKGRRYIVLKRFEEQINYVRRKLRNMLRFSKVFNTYLPMISEEYIEELYDPVKKLEQILREPAYDIDNVIIELVEKLSKAVPIDKIGIAGSRLADLSGPDQDIDLLITDYTYTRNIIKILREVKDPSNEKLIDLLTREHSKDIKTYSIILRNIIRRRVLENIFRSCIYFIRILLMRDYEKQIIYRKVRKISRILTHCKIIDEGELSYTTPSIHRVRTSIGVHYLLSDRGIFTDTLVILNSFKVCGVLEEGEILVPCTGEVITRWIYLDSKSRIIYP